jgi:hypothetical protein
MDFLYANSVLAVQNEGTYLPQISRKTCINNIIRECRLMSKCLWLYGMSASDKLVTKRMYYIAQFDLGSLNSAIERKYEYILNGPQK